MIVEMFVTGMLAIEAFSHGVAFCGMRGRTTSRRCPSAPGCCPSSLCAPPRGSQAFWLLATLGFVIAAISIWDSLLPGVTWHPLAAAAAAISTLGIVLFSGIWPGAPNRKLSKTDTIIALVINAAILVLLVVGWFAGAGMGG